MQNHECITLDVINVRGYVIILILSFADKETAAIFSGYAVRRLPLDMQQTARRKLKQLDAARLLDELPHPFRKQAGGVEGGPEGAVEHKDQ